MNSVFDIATAISKQSASFLAQTGVAPAICRVSRELYRALVERSAAVSSIGDLIVGTYAVTAIATETAKLRIVIDEVLAGTEVFVK